MKITADDLRKEREESKNWWNELFEKGYKTYRLNHPGLEMPEYSEQLSGEFRLLSNAICRVTNDPDAPGTPVDKLSVDSFKLFKFLKGKRTIKISFHGENKGEKYDLKNELLISLIEERCQKFTSAPKEGRPKERLARLITDSKPLIESLRDKNPDEFLCAFISKSVYRAHPLALGFNFDFDAPITGIIHVKSVDAFRKALTPARTKPPRK
jgi:hypothetical protein